MILDSTLAIVFLFFFPYTSAQMNICLFSEDEIGKPLLWHDERAEHLIKVLHKKEGDTFTAGIIEGKAGTAKITHIEPKKNIEFLFTPQTEGKFLYPLKMIIGFPRPIQLKRLLRDIAGLGVCSVHLTGTELSEKSYLQSTLVERGVAYQMLLDGTVQAGGTHVPHLTIQKTLLECLESLEKDGEESIKIALDNIDAKCSLQDFLTENAEKSSKGKIPHVVAAIGSERGWTENERRLLEKNGFTRCRMGERILRTETAATVASSIILNFMGVLN